MRQTPSATFFSAQKEQSAKGKVVVDAENYYPQRGGNFAELDKARNYVNRLSSADTLSTSGRWVGTVRVDSFGCSQTSHERKLTLALSCRKTTAALTVA